MAVCGVVLGLIKFVHHVAHSHLHEKREEAGTEVGDGNDDLDPAAELAEAATIDFVLLLELWLTALIVIGGSWIA